MAPKTFYLTLSRVDGPLFEGDAVQVTVPGSEGEMTILANHEPFISPLRKGRITLQTEHETKSYEIEGGTLEVSNNNATILV